MRSFIKRLVARLPWKARKLVMFFVEHGLVSRTPFSGVYASFGDVPGTMQTAEADQAAAAARGIAQGPNRDEATDLPRLRRAHSLMPLVVAMLAGEQRNEPVNILDFGGAAGVDFANLLAALGPQINVRYHVVDFPKVCAVGRDHWRDESRISFGDALPPSADFDLVYCWSSIHYVADPLGLLAQFAGYRPTAILLAGSPFTSGDAFVRAQVNQSVPFPQWVLSLPDLERRMEACGYAMVFHVAGEDDYNVDNYPPRYRVPNSASLLFLKSGAGGLSSRQRSAV
ncbi:MAG TPA: methyltransferase, TIGR04325 family [Xanthobacteraceae bacterium]|nr:methyltransferase, TIGR04325 family [Xanthobacteraceae bacterium]